MRQLEQLHSCKVKITVKNTGCPSLLFAAHGKLTVNLAFTLTSGAALTVPALSNRLMSPSQSTSFGGQFAYLLIPRCGPGGVAQRSAHRASQPARPRRSRWVPRWPPAGPAERACCTPRRRPASRRTGRCGARGDGQGACRWGPRRRAAAVGTAGGGAGRRSLRPRLPPAQPRLASASTPSNRVHVRTARVLAQYTRKTTQAQVRTLCPRTQDTGTVTGATGTATPRGSGRERRRMIPGSKSLPRKGCRPSTSSAAV